MFEPRHMVKEDILVGVLRPMVRETLGEVVAEITNQTVYMSKALFIYNRILIPSIMQWMTDEGFKAYLAECIYEDILAVVLPEEMCVVSQEDIQREQERLATEEKDKAFGEYVDGLIVESCLLRISKEYEAEESVRLKKEQREKEKRDELAASKRKLNRDTKEMQARYVKDEQLDQFNKAKALLRPEIRSVITNKANPDDKRLMQTTPHSVQSQRSQDQQPASQRSLQDAVKEQMKLQKVQDKPEAKNQLENILMNLHS